jgi:L-iditol 2-dehydrogenase
MLAALWHGPGLENLRLEEIKRPKVAYGEVLLRVKACYFGALSFRTITKGNPKLKPPRVLGRMISGDIVDVGEGVDLPIGIRVAVNPEAPCGKCFYCKRKEPAHCIDLPKLDPGGFAEYIKLAPQFVPGLVTMPDNISYEEGAYTESLACVLYGTIISGTTFGDVVVLLGCGGIGLTFISVLLRSGASKIIAIDIDPVALKMAKEMGATSIINSKEANIDSLIKEETNGCGADVVIEAVGSAETYSKSLNLVRAGGTVIGFGGCPANSSFELDPNLIHYKTIRFIGSWHYTPDLYQRAFDMIASSIIDINPIITHRLPLKQIHESIDIYPLSECKTLVILP